MWRSRCSHTLLMQAQSSITSLAAIYKCLSKFKFHFALESQFCSQEFIVQTYSSMCTKNYVKSHSLQLHWWSEEASLYVILYCKFTYSKKNHKFRGRKCDLYRLEIRSVVNSPTKGNSKPPFRRFILEPCDKVPCQMA